MEFTFRIRLLYVSKPFVWRRLLVPAHYSFDHLHRIIQVSFGWGDYHAYSFAPRETNNDLVIKIPSEIHFFPTEDARLHALSDYFREEKQTFIYEYDAGDHWTHRITLEKITPQEAGRPRCVAGKGKCPPEDCGGAWGYEEFKEKLSGPGYPDLREWAGLGPDQIWDPFEFDLERADALVQRL